MEKEEVQYTVIRDYARESNRDVSAYIDAYYVKKNELKLSDKVSLYVRLDEEVTMMYYFDHFSIDYLKQNITFVNNEEIAFLSDELMCKFDLVRVIPAGATPGYDSYIRVKLKYNAEFAKPISIEDEVS